jgi:hypothetical protein
MKFGRKMMMMILVVSKENVLNIRQRRSRKGKESKVGQGGIDIGGVKEKLGKMGEGDVDNSESKGVKGKV